MAIANIGLEQEVARLRSWQVYADRSITDINVKLKEFEKRLNEQDEVIRLLRNDITLLSNKWTQWMKRTIWTRRKK